MVNSGGNLSNAIDKFGAATALPTVIGTPLLVENVDCWFYASRNKACGALASNATDAFALQQLRAPGTKSSISPSTGNSRSGKPQP